MCRELIALFSCLFGVIGYLNNQKRRQRRAQGKHPDRCLECSWLESIMGANYDEDLSANKFLQEFQQQHQGVFQQAIAEGWIICVPRTGSFPNGPILEEDFQQHVLVPSEESPVTKFSTLSGKEVTLSNKVLTLDSDISKLSSHLLFEEIFYNEEFTKYRVWCIERPLEENSSPPADQVISVNNLRESVDFLWTEVLDKNLLRDVDVAIEEFEDTSEQLDNEPLHVQRDLVGSLYAKCLRILLKDTRLRDRTTSNRSLLQTLKEAVETYMLNGLRRTLLKSIASSSAQEDATLNKIIKNLHELQLRDLSDRTDLYDGVSQGKLELSRLDRFSTVLGKIECLRRAVRAISNGKTTVSSDDLLPIFIFLVIKVGLPNWHAQLALMKHFRFSSSSSCEADEAGFLVTTLEAAVEHVRSGVLIGSVNPESDNSELFSPEEGKVTKKNEYPLSYLFQSIKKGDLTEVRKILSTKRVRKSSNAELCHPLCTCQFCENSLGTSDTVQLTVHSRDDRGQTPLQIASLYGKVNIVDFLITNGANVNDADCDGVTPLHCASCRGYQHTLLLLLHANADPNVADSRGNTALHLSADHGHEDCVKAILYFTEQMRMPLDTSPANINMDTPLHHASKWGYTGIVEILLEHGADIKARNRRGLTPMSIAHNTQVCRLLESGTSNGRYKAVIAKPSSEHKPPQSPSITSSAKSEKSNTPESKVSVEKRQQADKLVAAVAEGDIRLVCYYLGLEGPRTVVRDRNSEELCHPLCICERCSPSESTSERNQKLPFVNINTLNSQGVAALHVASSKGFSEIVSLLLDAGANVNLATEPQQQTALHLACAAERIDIVKLLLACRNCSLDATDCVGDTPLHLITRNRNLRLLELLVRHGANTKIRNTKGLTPLDEGHSLEEWTSNNIFALSSTSVSRVLKGDDNLIES